MTLTGYDSPVEPTTWRWTQDMDRVIDAIDADTVLFGHSYGGFIALQAAMRRAVRAVIVWEPVVWSVIRGQQRWQRGEPLVDRSLSQRDWIRGFIDFWNGAGAWEAMAARHRAPFEHFGAKVRLEVEALLTDETSLERWGSLKTPTLVIRGDQTIDEAVACCAGLAKALPNATEAVVRGAGHMGPVTAEAEMRALCERWLQTQQR